MSISRKHWILGVWAGMLLAVGCDKVKYQADAQDYYPKLGATSVRVQPDGSALVTGTLESAGAGDLYFLGFCMDTAPAPQMHIGQKLAYELVGNSFNGSYGTLDGTRRYYIRSFAANEYGFAYGGETVIDWPAPDTTQIPCHPADRAILVEGGNRTQSDTIYDIEALDPIYHKFSVASYTYGYSLRIEFGRTPTSGVYKIWEHVDNGSDQVSVLLSIDGSGYYLANGGTMHVQQLDAKRIRVWLCHQAVGNGTFITTAFSTP